MSPRRFAVAGVAGACKQSSKLTIGSERVAVWDWPRRLRRLRRELGISPADLARRLGLAPNTVARWERAPVPSPRFVGALGHLERAIASGTLSAIAWPRRLRALRKEVESLNWTTKDLAARLGLPLATFLAWEQEGEWPVGWPRLVERVGRIERALNARYGTKLGDAA